jgi:hypothetical protein
MRREQMRTPVFSILAAIIWCSGAASRPANADYDRSFEVNCAKETVFAPHTPNVGRQAIHKVNVRDVDQVVAQFGIAPLVAPLINNPGWHGGKAPERRPPVIDRKPNLSTPKQDRKKDLSSRGK